MEHIMGGKGKLMNVFDGTVEGENRIGRGTLRMEDGIKKE